MWAWLQTKLPASPDGHGVVWRVAGGGSIVHRDLVLEIEKLILRGSQFLERGPEHIADHGLLGPDRRLHRFQRALHRLFGDDQASRRLLDPRPQLNPIHASLALSSAPPSARLYAVRSPRRES